jgi:hypothetical protein
MIEDYMKSDTTSHFVATVDTSGWVVELEKDVWLLSADADPSRTLVLKNATRWPTERSAKRAMSRVRKHCRHKFHGAKIYHVGE